jgi:hypothetical protein
MTMTGFFTHCFKSSRPEKRASVAWIGVWICVCCLVLTPLLSRAQANNTEISQIQVERNPDGVFLFATLRFELPPVVEDALLKGVPLFFVVQADVYRDRWYWTDKKILSAERHMRLAYQPLTRRWRLNMASGVITPNSLGVALNQSFDSLSEALAAMRRVSRWKIAEAAEIDADQKHSLEVKFELDVSQLPRPFQIGVLGQPEWIISAQGNVRVPAQSGK